MRGFERGSAVGREGAIAAVLLALAAPAVAQRDTVPERECTCVRIETPAGARGGAFIFRPGGERMAALRMVGARARLGVELAMEAGSPGAGAVVRRVLPRSPAEEAGLRAGDEIVALDATSLLRALPEGEPPVAEGASAPARRLMALMEGVEPGDTVRLEVVRDGRRTDVTVVTEEGTFMMAARSLRGLGGELERSMRPELERSLRALERQLGDSMRPELERSLRALERDMEHSVRPELERSLGELSRLRALGVVGARTALAGAPLLGRGVRVSALNAELASYFGVEQGVLVLDTRDDAPFDLRGGDVISAVDGRPVRDPDQLFRILRSYGEDETIRLEVVRRGSRITVEGPRR
ncbi:MAG TPA: PDZ domain-containing protein [Longimicrobiales bacterium]|nr:PDZ domain-containing protein [Longimicrobiales bacterium]